MVRDFLNITLVTLLFQVTINAQEKPMLSYFNLQDVTLRQSPFKHAEDLNKEYLLELDADRLLAPFLREAGLTPKAQSYTNWENTGLDGHIGGHYLSGLSLMYASSGDTAIRNRLDYMISELKRCQDANGNGYIGGVPGGKAIWQEIASGNIKAGGFDLNGKWVPLYNIHKTYAGLRDAYLVAGNITAKEMLIKMTDWAVQLVSRLSDTQIQDMLRSEHGGLNETFADVAAITGNEKYLKLAHRFSHLAILDPLLHHEDKLTGMHANTQIPKVLGFKRISEVEGNASWEDAARFFWETVVQQRSVSIGGNSISEHFNPVSDFSRMVTSIEGPETCNTYNMLRLSKMLYQTSKDKKYMDYYERALYNHILSTQHPETGGLVYFTQMRPGHYRVYSQPQTSMWCCVGSGLESHSKYGEMIYAHTGHELYVNLFIPSALNWKEKKVRIVQENHFPDEAKTKLTIHPHKATSFTLQLRWPEWVAAGALKVSVNGKHYPAQNNNGYVAISRKWRKGDVVTMEMPMQLHTEQLPDHSNYYTFLYGPVVLAAKTTADDQQGLFADDSRGGHIARGKQIPLKDMPIVVGNANSLPALLTPVKGKPLTFQLNSLFPEKYATGMELIPFYRLHASRYIIYWPQATTAGVKEIQKKIEAEEQERIKLDGVTVDKVVCGEQQPESDHFIQQQDSRTGFTDDVHWREARGWFSYRVKTTGAAQLYLKYFDNDKNRNFDVLINGSKLTTLQLNGGKGNVLQTKVISIPTGLLNLETAEIRINAHSEFMTGKIAEIRLLRKQ
ncbi:beta-L-arabinofuranosidase domain-containing protein [Niabella aquatica]